MIIEVKTNNEYHKNGQLAYTETIGKLAFHTNDMYPNRRQHDDGFYFIRMFKNAKYFDNGQLAWEINYDNMGNVVKEDSRQFRKDGTVIIY